MKQLKLLSVLLCALLIYNNARANGADESRPMDMEEPSEDYAVTVNGKPVYVYKARVSKYPINQEWPGYQRPLEQTEIASFAYFDFHKGDFISITPKAKVEAYNVRPSQYGIESTLTGNTISFTVKKPCQLVVEVNGYHKALHLFVNPAGLAKRPDVSSPKVRYFGPGYHDAGTINVQSGETVYIDEGAVVYGSVVGVGVHDVNITGKGILDGSKMERTTGWENDNVPGIVRYANIGLFRSKNVRISGIILRDPCLWTVVPLHCEDIDFDNVKLIGLWRYNADGIDVCNSSHVRIRNCFLRTFDDGVVIKGLSFLDYYEKEKDGPMIIKDIKVDNCVLWCDWGRALEIGAETHADEMKDVHFTNCHVVRFTHFALDVQSWHHARVHDIYFNNIYVEEPIWENAFYLGDKLCNTEFDYGYVTCIAQPVRDKTPENHGMTDHIYFNKIYYTGSTKSHNLIKSYDDNHYISDVLYKDCYLNGRKIGMKDITTVRRVERVSVK